MANAGLEILLSQQGARSDIQLRGSASYIDYIDGTYESELLPALDATATFRITDQAVRWFFQGNVGQASVDPFQPISPGSRWMVLGRELRDPGPRQQQNRRASIVHPRDTVEPFNFADRQS